MTFVWSKTRVLDTRLRRGSLDEVPRRNLRQWQGRDVCPFGFKGAQKEGYTGLTTGSARNVITE